MKGLPAFFERFNAAQGQCFKHIIENCRKHIHGTGRTFDDKLAWSMRNAPTEDGFLAGLQVIRAQCPAAAHYFATRVDHSKAYQYALNAKGVATHGFKTSQIVECVNGVFTEARHHAPYRFNNHVLAWLGNQFDKRLKEITKWVNDGHLLTPYAHRLFRLQVRAHALTHVPCRPMP